VRLELDENLPLSLVELFASHDHEAITVVEEGLSGADDSVVAAAAASEQRILVTLDREFADIRAHPPGTHPGILVVRLDTPRPSHVRAALSGLLTRHRLEDLAGCVSIVQLGSVRVRRPRPTSTD